MPRKLIGILFSFVCLFLLAAPASAVNIPGCGEFVVVARDRLILESGAAMEINGNLIVTSAAGRMEVGRFNVINGDISAFEIQFGNDAAVNGNCNFTVDTGVDPFPPSPPGVCDTVTTPFVFPTCVPDTLFTPPVIGCDVEAAPDLTVPAGGVGVLNAGDCKRWVKLGNDAVLTVTGNANVKQIQAGIGVAIVSNVVNTRRIINVKNGGTAGSGFHVTDITLNFGGTANGAVVFGNGGVYTRALINVPVGGVHIRSGSTLVETEVIGQGVIIEPSKTPPVNNVCECPKGTKFQLPPDPAVFNASPVDIAARNCVKCEPGDLFPSCLP